MTGNLDEMLSAPLPAVEDAGFSTAVARRTRVHEERHKLLDILAVLVGLIAIAVALPLDGLMVAIETVTLRLGNSLPVAIACAALALTFAFVRMVDRPE